MGRQQTTDCKLACRFPARAYPPIYLPYLLPHKGPKNSRGNEARRDEEKRGEARRGVAAAAEQTNLMRVHNDTNLNDNASVYAFKINS